MRAYGENEQNGRYVLEDFQFSRNHTRSLAAKRWKRDLKNKARAASRQEIHRIMMEVG